jgi:hypothetical protein
MVAACQTRSEPSAERVKPRASASSRALSSAKSAKPDTGPAPDAAPIGRRTPGLDFTIVSTYSEQKPIKTPPWHAPRGSWTFIDAKTSDGAEFTLGWRTTRRPPGDFVYALGEGVIGTADASSGKAFLDACARAFQLTAGSPTAAGSAPATVFVLGEKQVRDPDGSFTDGNGSWTATKWAIDYKQDSTEFYVNFDTSTKRGEIVPRGLDRGAGLLRALE